MNTLDKSVINIYMLSLPTGSDIVQWMIKNLDIEDQGKNAGLFNQGQTVLTDLKREGY